MQHPDASDKPASPPAPAKPGRQEAIVNPAASFDHPIEVVDAPALSDIEKAKALDAWEADERALQRASEEGMTGGTPPRLAEVKQAKKVLVEQRDGGDHESRPGSAAGDANDKL